MRAVTRRRASSDAVRVAAPMYRSMNTVGTIEPLRISGGMRCRRQCDVDLMPM
jgi:hypothetical protein